MKSILIVDDEKNLRDSLREYLQYEGFCVHEATTLAEARAAAGSHPDLVLLDWMLPDGQGILLLKEWRSRFKLILLTARVDLVDKVLALEGGADDYVTKPFQVRELLARIHVQLREPAPSRPDRTLTSGELLLQHSTRKVTLSGVAISLKKMEYNLLKWFMENPDRVFSRDEILNQVWGYEAYPTTRTVDTHILQLRNKLGDNRFETIRGVGYRFLSSKIDAKKPDFSPPHDNAALRSWHPERQ